MQTYTRELVIEFNTYLTIFNHHLDIFRHFIDLSAGVMKSCVWLVGHGNRLRISSNMFQLYFTCWIISKALWGSFSLISCSALAKYCWTSSCIVSVMIRLIFCIKASVSTLSWTLYCNFKRASKMFNRADTSFINVYVCLILNILHLWSWSYIQ